MTDEQTTALLLAVGIPTALLAPLVISAVYRRVRSIGGGTDAGRVVNALAMAILFNVGIGVALHGLNPNQQGFESFGLAKQVGLPAVYILFTLAVFWPRKTPLSRTVYPWWWFALAALLIISSALALFVPRQEMGVGALLQSIALIGGLLVIAMAGLHARTWQMREQRALLALLATTAILVQFLGLATGPFVALTIPGAFMTLFLGTRLTRWRVPVFMLGALAVVVAARGLILDSNASIAVITQLGSCAALLVALWLPRALRMLLVSVGVIGAVVAAAQNGLFQLLRGDASGVNDVTLSHRAYEAAAVERLLGNPVTFIFGQGPAATVDLTMSPDRGTLLASGRILAAVDDVHFVTSWMLLKFGILGLVWFVGFFIVALREARRVLQESRPDYFDASLLFFLIAGVVTALPAATHLFANPLPILCLSILVARSRQKQRGGNAAAAPAMNRRTSARSRTRREGSLTEVLPRD
jgi:hypothetical protein